MSAAVFAEKKVVEKIGKITFRKIQDNPFVHLELTDIPISATITTENNEALKVYTEKLKNYSFYLQANIMNEHFMISNEVNKAISILTKEYHLE